MILLLLKLMLAHVIGDFLLQPKKWVKEKIKNKHKSKYLYFHVIIHALALIVVLKFELKFWLGILVITLSHYFIDLIKLNLNKKVKERYLFLVDQIAHIIIITIVAALYSNYNFNIDVIYSKNLIALILAIITLTSVTSVIMQLVMNKWKLDEDNTENSLDKAGKYIGILERLFVFGFIVLSQWSAIGLLITAKSVFRFGDLSKAKNRKLTEYVLIGTLLSFGIAILIGLLFNYVIKD